MSIKSIACKVFAAAKYYRYRALDVSIDRSASLRSVELEGLNKIGARTKIYDSRLGYGSYVANDSVVTGTKMGRYCSLGPNIAMPTGLHPTSGFASTSPLFFSLRDENRSFVSKQKFNENRFAEDGWLRVIGNDVWIGGNAVILEV